MPLRAKTGSSGAKARKLVQELKLRQIQLELQNAELERAKAQAEASHDELFDLAPVGYFTLDADGVICNANLAGADMLGCERSDLAGECFTAFVAAAARAEFSAFLAQVFLGQNKEGRMFTLTRAGNVADVPVFAYIEASAAEPKSTCRVVAVDVTSSRLAERARDESEARLELALAAAKMGVWEWDYQTNEVYWSPQCCDIFGLKMLCVPLATLTRLLHPQDAAGVMGVLTQALGDRSDHLVECRIVPAGGEVVWISAHGRAEFDSSGQPLRLFGIVRNITARKRAEENMRRALEDTDGLLQAMGYVRYR